jgi:hypothetical protein
MSPPQSAYAPAGHLGEQMQPNASGLDPTWEKEASVVSALCCRQISVDVGAYTARYRFPGALPEW